MAAEAAPPLPAAHRLAGDVIAEMLADADVVLPPPIPDDELVARAAGPLREAGPLIGEAFVRLRPYMAEPVVLAEPLDAVTASAIEALTGLHGQALTQLSEIVAGARTSGGPVERQSLLAAIEKLATRPEPHIEVNVQPATVEVHTPEMRPEIRVDVAAAPTPDVHVTLPEQPAPQVHVATAAPVIEVQPAAVVAAAPVLQPVHIHVPAEIVTRQAPTRTTVTERDGEGLVVETVTEPVE